MARMPTAAPPAIHGLVPMAHVADVERSIRFYGLLGLEPTDRLRDGPRTRWARLRAGDAALMLAAATAPVVPEQQAVLLYLYCRDVSALRDHLLARGVADAGGPADALGTVSAVTRPPYMPAGEIRIADPDGYCLLVGQTD